MIDARHCSSFIISIAYLATSGLYVALFLTVRLKLVAQSLGLLGGSMDSFQSV